MDRRKALAQSLDRRRERLVGAVHVGEQGVAAAVGRQLLHVEDAAHRRLRDRRLTSECHSSPATCLEFSSALMTRTSGCSPLRVEVGMQVQLAEAAAERLVLLVAELLVAEEDHQVRHQRVMDFLERLVAQWPGEIDAEDLRADAGRELAHLDRLVSHWRFLTFAASLREKETMSDSLILRAATAVDAPRSPRSSPRRSRNIAAGSCPNRAPSARRRTASPPSSPDESGAIIAERNGEIVGCVMVKLMEDDLYFGRLSVVPDRARPGHRPPPDRGGRGRGAPPRTGRRAAGRAHRAHGKPAPVQPRWDMSRSRARRMRVSTIRPRSTCARRCADVFAGARHRPRSNLRVEVARLRRITMKIAPLEWRAPAMKLMLKPAARTCSGRCSSGRRA